MNENRKPFPKEQIERYWNEWQSQRTEIEALYREKNPQVRGRMLAAIQNYEEMLSMGGVEATGAYRIAPLNEVERRAFVKSNMATRSAYIQLNALYTESRKKAARLSVQPSARNETSHSNPLAPPLR